MGKDFLNGNGGLIIKIAALVFAIGAAGQMLMSHEGRIGDVEKKAHATELEVVGLKADVKYIRTGIDDIKKGMKK